MEPEPSTLTCTHLPNASIPFHTLYRPESSLQGHRTSLYISLEANLIVRQARIDPNAPKDAQEKRRGWKDVGHVRSGSRQRTVFQCPPVREAGRCLHDTAKSHLELASSSIPNTLTRTFVR